MDKLNHIPVKELGILALGVTGNAVEYTAPILADALSQDSQRPAVVAPNPDTGSLFGYKLAYAADRPCNGQEVPFEIVGKQVPFIDLERLEIGTGRPGIFDKGVKVPMDPYFEAPALGGQMVATSLDGNTEYKRDTFTQKAPKIAYVPNLDQNVAYAHVQFNAACNTDYVKPDGTTVPGLHLRLGSTQHPENTSYKTTIATKGVAVEWFGRELGVEHKTNEDSTRETILHPEVVERILNDKDQPIRDLTPETRAKLSQSIKEVIQKQSQANVQVESDQDKVSGNWLQERLNDLGHLANRVGEGMGKLFPIILVLGIIAAVAIAVRRRRA